MNLLFVLHDRFAYSLNHIASEILPLLARLVFASTLTLFFWRAAMTKLGDGFAGLFVPSIGAYAQVLPTRFEAAGYDPDALGFLDWLIVFAGTWGEIILPIMIVLGLGTRLAAIGMMAFILVMSYVDICAHGVIPGTMFDGDPTGIILDQRLYWGLALLILLCHGAGKLSLDQFLYRFRK